MLVHYIFPASQQQHCKFPYTNPQQQVSDLLCWVISKATLMRQRTWEACTACCYVDTQRVLGSASWSISTAITLPQFTSTIEKLRQDEGML